MRRTCCRAVRGDTYSPSPLLNLQPHTFHTNGYHHYHHHRVAPLTSQDFVVSLQNVVYIPESVNLCTATLAQTQSKGIHRHAQTFLRSHLRMMLLVLLISVLPNAYSGACTHRQSRLTLTRSLPHVNRNLRTVIFAPNPENSPHTQTHRHINMHTYILQHSRQHLKWSLKPPLAHTSKCPPKER